VGGFDVAHAAKSVRRRISLTGQFAAVDDVLSARENLELIGELRHVSDPRQTATTLLANFDLTDAADRRVATFSGGMRRRLDIAMGLIGSPEIIFLDEPTNGLDPQSRLQMWATIRALARGGTTVFLTTQYLEEADELADTIAVLHLGRIIAVGTAEELKGLVPSGHVRLSFADDVQLDAAVATLASEFDVIDRHLLTITVATGGSATRIADLFVRLRDAQIEPSDFAQQAPTLDDAFLALTRSK
jgi:ABC-2 type transport system ATP-binding protein